MSLRDAFAGMGAPAPNGVTRDSNGSGAQVPKGLRTPAPLALQNTAKSKHPEFEAVKVYLRRNTHKLARRKCEDEGQGDFSDLVERLLREYLTGA